MAKFWKNYRKFIEKVLILFYYMLMNKTCRILSIIVSCVLFISTVICCVIVFKRSENKNVYAKSINFNTVAGGIELYIDNDLIVDSDMLIIEPGNYTVKPQFTIKQYGDDEETIITDNKYSFCNTGRYLLKCKIKCNADYYISDTMSIMVVERPTDNTSMYIHASDKLIYVDDVVRIDELATIEAPNSATIDISCSHHLQINNNNVTAVADGNGHVSIIVEYNNVKISKIINITIKPKAVSSNIKLKIYYAGNTLVNNTLEITSNEYSTMLNYALTNTDSQLINCWTNDNIVRIDSFNPDTIILTPMSNGETIIYVSPLENLDIVFEIVVKVNVG